MIIKGLKCLPYKPKIGVGTVVMTLEIDSTIKHS